MKNGKRLLSTVLAAALFITQPGGTVLAGAAGEGAAKAAEAAASAADWVTEAVAHVMEPVSAGPTARTGTVYTLDPDTRVTVTFDEETGTITAFDDPDHVLGISGVTIPEQINGVDVVAIGEGVFAGNDSLISIMPHFPFGSYGGSLYLPEGLKSIGERAFWGCENLDFVSPPDSLETVGDYAFSYCSKLVEVLAQEMVSIGEYAFQACSALNTISFTDALQTIGDYAFSSCSALTGFAVPETVTEIPDGMFSGCENLQYVSLHDGITSIGYNAFSDCTSLQYSADATGGQPASPFALPERLETIGYCAFEGCVLLDTALPDGVQSIGYSAFEGTGLTEVTIPASVTSLGDSAFRDCENLESVEIRAALDSNGTGSSLFAGCTALETVTLADGVTTVGESMFDGCTALESVALPDSVTGIGRGVFKDCTGLTAVSLPAEAEGIQISMFENCTSLQRIDIPAGVEAIYARAFYGCSALDEISIPSGIRQIDEYAFYGCTGLTSIRLSADNRTDIGPYAFSGCTGLTSVELPERVTLDDSAFSGCTGLDSIVVPAEARVEGAFVFAGCTGLTSVTLADGLSRIGENMFSACTSLTAVTIPDSVSGIGDNAFADCTSLSSAALPDVYSYPIPDGMFAGCTALQSITIPPVVTLIGDSAFAGCTGLAAIDIPASVTGIRSLAFAECTSLQSATIRGEEVSFGDDVSGWTDDYTELVSRHIFYNTPDTFVIYGVPGSTTQSYAEERGIEFLPIESAAETRTLTVAVSGPDGEPITDGFTIRWYEGGSAEPLPVTGTVLNNAGTTQPYAVEIVLGAGLAARYQQPARQTVAAGTEDAAITVTLAPAVMLTLTGSVQDSAEAPVMNASVIITPENREPVAAQMEGSRFTATIPATASQIRISADGYYSRRFSIYPDADASTYEVGAVTLHETIADRIALDVAVQRAAPADETPLTEPLYALDGLEFTLTGDNGRAITDFEVQGTAIVFHPGAVHANEQISIAVSDREGRYGGTNAGVTLDKDKIGRAAVTLLENGGFRIGSMNTNEARLLVFGEDGALLESMDACPGMQSEPMQPGSYTMVFLEKNSMLPGVTDLDMLDDLQVEHVRISGVMIEAGRVSSLTNINVPALDLDALIRTDADGTGLSVSTQTPAQGTQFYLRADYALSDPDGSAAQSMRIDLPEGIEALPGRIFLDGRPASYTGSSSLDILLGGQSAGTVIVYCAAGAAAGDCGVNAYLAFADGALQPIGTAGLTVGEADLNLPEKTALTAVPVTGTALPYSTVTVYDNGAALGSTTANAVGSWSLDVRLDEDTLYNYSYHNINAVIESGAASITTDSRLLVYDAAAATLSKITVYNTYNVNNVIGTGETVLDFTSASTVQPFYYYCPDFMDFTFKVEFDGNAAALDTVTVVTEGQNGEVVRIPAEYDQATGCWLATCEYNTHNVPVAIGAEFTGGESSVGQFDAQRFIDYSTESIEAFQSIEDAVESGALDDIIDPDDFSVSDDSEKIIIDDEGGEDDLSVSLELEYIGEGDEQKVGDYTVTQVSDSRTELELANAGYQPIQETLYHKFEFFEDATTFSNIYVNTEEHICITETIQFVDNRPEQLRQAAALPVARSFELSAESLSPYLNSVMTIASFLPGWGDVVSLTNEGVLFLGKQKDWRNLITDNQAMFDERIQQLVQLAESRCGDGSPKLGSQYNYYLGMLNMLSSDLAAYVEESENTVNQSILCMLLKVVTTVFSKWEALKNWYDKADTAVYNKVMQTIPDNVKLKMQGMFSALEKYNEWKSVKNTVSVNYKYTPHLTEGLGNWMERVTLTVIESVTGTKVVTEVVGAANALHGGVSYLTQKLTDLGIEWLSIDAVEQQINGNAEKLDQRITDLGIEISRALRSSICEDPGPGPGGAGGSGGSGGSGGGGGSGGSGGTGTETQKRHLKPVYDPAGFVYEAVPSNRLEGVTATVYRQGSDAAWDAAAYDQINPQVTDSTGMYAWFVPDGNWKVMFTKDGYQPADSSNVPASVDGWLPVPPPQFEVNVGMVSTAAPAVERAVAYTDRIEVAFSQYMDIASVQAAVSLSRGGQPATVTVTALDAEDTLDGSTQYATRFAVIPADGVCTGTITVSTGAKNYAGTALEAAHTAELAVPVQRPTGIAASGQLGVVYGGSATVALTLQPGIAGKTLEVESLTPSLLSAPATVTTGADGTAAVTLTGLLPGDGLIRVTEPESGLSETISIPIVLSADGLTDAEKPAPVTATLSDGTPVTSGMTLEGGAQITLSTATEGAVIRYTLDDTCPCKDAALTYTGPITITENTVLRAAALLDGVYSDTIRLELTVSGGAEEPENPDDPGGSGGSSSGGGGGGGLAADNRPSVSTGEGGTVTAGDGTVTITPDEGYRIGSVTVNGEEVEIPTDGILTGLDSDDEVTVAFERITDDTGLPFADVAPASWYHDAVQYVYENGMMNGTSDTLFSPDGTTTRAMIVTILHRLENAPPSAASGFTDVAAGMYYADAVDWAAANGIVNGVSETAFAPDDPITREQMAAILYRYAQFKGYDVTASADLGAYTDAAQISAYATAAMQWANENGLITGNTGTTLNPKGHATRAEAATILMRFCQDTAA